MPACRSTCVQLLEVASSHLKAFLVISCQAHSIKMDQLPSFHGQAFREVSTMYRSPRPPNGGVGLRFQAVPWTVLVRYTVKTLVQTEQIIYYPSIRIKLYCS